jgi:hypothetical protein
MEGKPTFNAIGSIIKTLRDGSGHLETEVVENETSFLKEL